MEVIDISSLYSQTAVSASWDRYCQSYPELFRHYFRYWARQSYPNTKLTQQEIEYRSLRITKRLAKMGNSFQESGLSMGELSVVLFVGKGCTNGHAFCDDGNWVVWIPVETYGSDRLIDVFVTHEIAHALHYMNSPQFYFESVTEKRHFGRQLITEGIATYMTARVLKSSDSEALWGGYLPQKQLREWTASCKANISRLASSALRFFDTGSHSVMFRGDIPGDVFKFRGGYYLGLKVIQRVVQEKRISLDKLISMPRTKLEPLVFAVLEDLALSQD